MTQLTYTNTQPPEIRLGHRIAYEVDACLYKMHFFIIPYTWKLDGPIAFPPTGKSLPLTLIFILPRTLHSREFHAPLKGQDESWELEWRIREGKGREECERQKRKRK